VAPWGSWLQLIAVVSESHKLCDCVLVIDRLRAQQTNQPTCTGWCASSTASTHKQKCKRSIALSHDDVLFFKKTLCETFPWEINLQTPNPPSALKISQNSTFHPPFCPNQETAKADTKKNHPKL